MAGALGLEQRSAGVPDGAPVEPHGLLEGIAHDVVQAGRPGDLVLVVLCPGLVSREGRVPLPAAIDVTGRVDLTFSLGQLLRPGNGAVVELVVGMDLYGRFGLDLSRQA